MAMELAGVDRNVVFGRRVRSGLVLGLVTGAGSGTAAAPVLGTFVGAVVGLCLAIPISLVAAAAIARSGVVSLRGRPPPGDRWDSP
jgi:hypothetical protein